MDEIVALFKRAARLTLEHRYGVTLFAYLAAAAATGVACVGFMRAFDFVISRRLDFESLGAWCWLTTPLGFLIAVEAVRRSAPCAAGTGIPQAIFAAKHLSDSNEERLAPLTSPLTLIIKVTTLLAAIWVGASSGREGPTVHVAACVFVGVLLLFRKWFGLAVDMRSAVIAGGAAGLAAAFNTPLAGVTFAIEELTTDYFGSIKDFVLMAIIVAALAAKSLTGEYAYFGRLMEPAGVPLSAVVIIGLLGGVLGAFFSTAILKGQKALDPHRGGHGRWLIPVALSWALLAVAWAAGDRVLGPGNQAAQQLVLGQYGSWCLGFPLAKMAATLCTYWSGIAGGIFAPCLAIGASLGGDVANWMGVSVASCALVGMAAFLSGTIQAPITSFVIIFEMTGHHIMLLPIMLASLLAFMTARLLGASHLYQALSENYRPLLRE